jgi:hypothetical protein
MENKNKLECECEPMKWYWKVLIALGVFYLMGTIWAVIYGVA